MNGAQCISCKHYEGNWVCPFFPNGIPAEIASGVELHDEYRNYEKDTKWADTPKGLK